MTSKSVAWRRRFSSVGALLLILVVLECQGSGVRVEKKKKRKDSGSRRERFPSVAERVKIYMSNWYVPPCSGKTSNTFRYRLLEGSSNRVEISDLKFSKTIDADMAFWLDEDILMDCARSQEQYLADQASNVTLRTEEFVKFRHNMRMYCRDVVEMVEIVHHLDLESKDEKGDQTPMLLQFGDMKHSHVFGLLNLPHFKKFRSATSNIEAVTSRECISETRKPLDTAHGSETLQPIVWKLATHRHYKFLPDVAVKDTPWEDKKDVAVWRGQLTGALESYDKSLSPKENCLNMSRCRLVLEMAPSKFVNAKLTTTRGRLPDQVDGVDLVVPKTGVDFQMRYKGIIMLEGNDVASGLKWALLSQSVVLMPPPKHTSWAMEELLKPWVHYIPLNENATDVAERMKWVVNHDEEARLISARATLWMEDLVFHPDAARDDRLIKEEIVRRYRAHFVKG